MTVISVSISWQCGAEEAGHNDYAMLLELANGQPQAGDPLVFRVKFVNNTDREIRSLFGRMDDIEMYASLRYHFTFGNDESLDYFHASSELNAGPRRGRGMIGPGESQSYDLATVPVYRSKNGDTEYLASGECSVYVTTFIRSVLRKSNTVAFNLSPADDPEVERLLKSRGVPPFIAIPSRKPPLSLVNGISNLHEQSWARKTVELCIMRGRARNERIDKAGLIDLAAEVEAQHRLWQDHPLYDNLKYEVALAWMRVGEADETVSSLKHIVKTYENSDIRQEAIEQIELIQRRFESATNP